MLKAAQDTRYGNRRTRKLAEWRYDDAPVWPGRAGTCHPQRLCEADGQHV